MSQKIKFLSQSLPSVQKQSYTRMNANGGSKGELLTVFHVSELQTLATVQRGGLRCLDGSGVIGGGGRAVGAFTIDLPMPMSCLTGTERQTAERLLLPTARELCQILGNYVATKWKIFRRRITKSFLIIQNSLRRPIRNLYIPFFIHSSIALQPFVGPWPLLQFRHLFYSVGRTPWKSD
jgi:hypothetical protein